MKRPEIGRLFWTIRFSRMYFGGSGWRQLDIALFSPKQYPPGGAMWGRREMKWGFWWQIHFWLPVSFNRTPK